ncbi:hypothetical protein [Rhizobium altiplani]|nr:hypothetical protein [Rhizobium altiplani]
MLGRLTGIALLAMAAPIRATAADFTLGNWNIPTLVYPGDPETVFPDDHIPHPARLR